MPDPSQLDQLAENRKTAAYTSTTMEFWISPSGEKAHRKAKVWVTSFLTNIRETEAMGSIVAALKMTTSFTFPAKLTRLTILKLSTPNWRWRASTPATCDSSRTKKAKGGNKTRKLSWRSLGKMPAPVGKCRYAARAGLSAGRKQAIRYLSFLTLKPTMYIANVNEDGFENNPYLDQVREIAAKEGSVVVPVCAAVEATLPNWTNEERDEFMCRSLGWKSRA
ncbi:hypothetical protein ACNKHU_07240 [Shigella flexneri]